MLISPPALLPQNWQNLTKGKALQGWFVCLLFSKEPQSVKDIVAYTFGKDWDEVEKTFDTVEDDPKLSQACARAFNGQAKLLVKSGLCWNLAEAFTREKPFLLSLIAPTLLEDTVLGLEEGFGASSPLVRQLCDDTTYGDKVGERIVKIATNLSHIDSPALHKKFREATDRLSNPLKTRLRNAYDEAVRSQKTILASLLDHRAAAKAAPTAQP